MPFSSSGPRAVRQTAGAFGAVALIALCAAPAVAADGPATGLALGTIAPFDKVKPGIELPLSPAFTNTGTAALDKVWLSYSATRGLGRTALPSNCLSYTVGSAAEEPGHTQVVCEFDQPVQTGVVYAPERPLNLKALDRALYEHVQVAVDSSAPVPDDGATPVHGTAPALKLVERPDEKTPPAGAASSADVAVNAASAADFQVGGAQLKGKAGDTVTLRVRFANAGPAWVLPQPGQRAAHVLITLPEGTSAVRTDKLCTNTGAESYACNTGAPWVNEHESRTYTFKVKLDKAVPGARGYVELGSEARPFDHVKKNDTARIALSVTGGTDTTGGGSTGDGGSKGGGGSTGGTGSTTSTGGTGTGTTGGTTMTGGTTGTTSGTGTTGDLTTGGSGSTGGSLASTGAGSALPLAGAAGAAVIVGAGVVVAARRRGGRED
ncbi:hypothetical protein GTY81_24645 [Streptomyces sp. SID8366]|uniref:hypothetical protein n=1 Tax=unclassified Streptomyces TaxID=2593676 RepID=UPI000DB98FDC|nr:MULTISPECIES: hypothetical protein [unclassified Streptomyces]MYU06999.1 hypothetical protein [Streptomyces sp. SID8366]MYU65319.1 hypothetical protein [Streptomyces sp. SID69]RAJ61235.1 hypothetical protein K376_02086 [Streptomyces sp. PsTaAH-130]